MDAEVDLPWPTEPVLCQSCERWVGRARAVPASAVPAPETGHDTGHTNGASTGSESSQRRSHPRRRATRPAPAERRRARELGPPPVPRFASESLEAEDDLDLHDDAFAVTGVWDAPVLDSNGSDQTVVTEPAEADLDGPVEPWTTSVGGPEEELSSPAQANGSHGGALAEEADELERTGSPWIDDYEDDDLGPPAPFFLPAGADEATNGSTPAAPDAESPRAEPIRIGRAETQEDLPGSTPSGTLPFWSVPSEPVKPKRRLSLERLRPRRPHFRRPTRAGLMRALPIVLLVVGALLLIEGALTVLWKEPFSAIFAAQSQGALDGDLDALERKSAAEADAARDQKALTRLQRRRSVTLNRDTAATKPIGRLRVDKINLNEVVVQGTDEETSLTKGPGHYTETPLPGQAGNWTVGIAGHRTTYGAPFRNVNKLKKGDEIVFSVPYGRFTYEVDRTRIVDASYQKAFTPKKYDQIVLTACHPLYSAAQRILVYGKLTKSEPRGGARAAAKLKP